MTKEEEVKHVFTTPDLMYVWEEFRRLGFDTQVIADEMWAKKKETAPDELDGNFFLRYGVEVLQPMLNKRLNRPFDHPTFFNMLHYLLKHKIAKDPWLNQQKRGLADKSLDS